MSLETCQIRAYIFNRFGPIVLGAKLVNYPEQIGYKLTFTSYDSFLHVN